MYDICPQLKKCAKPEQISKFFDLVKNFPDFLFFPKIL